MVAFCVIVGDTIPHVLAAIFPSLSQIPVISIITNRRAVIIIFIFLVSYPLSLYKDIAKVSYSVPNLYYLKLTFLQLAKASTMALISMLIILITVITQGFNIPNESKGKIRDSLVIKGGVFQAIGVISFGTCMHPMFPKYKAYFTSFCMSS